MCVNSAYSVRAIIKEYKHFLEFIGVDTAKLLFEVEEYVADGGTIEAFNSKVRTNLAKQTATEDAEVYAGRYKGKTAEIEAVRSERLALLQGAQFPLGGLSIGKDDKGLPVLEYGGKAWDCMSGMEKVRVGVAIVRKLSPGFGFVLLDGLECFDPAQLQELQKWIEAEDLQAIATRVSTGGECSLVIEDGQGEMPDPQITQSTQKLILNI